MDIATEWADPRVYDIVKKKWDTLPKPSDKKGGKKDGSAGKRPGSSAPKVSAIISTFYDCYIFSFSSRFFFSNGCHHSYNTRYS